MGVVHAVIVNVGIERGHEAEAEAFLKEHVLPAMKQIPGIRNGYWLEVDETGHGVTVFLFDTEQDAIGFAEGLPGAPRAEFASLQGVSVREVVGQI